MFRVYEISLVIDVGANSGQFAQGLRTQIGYSGRIVSFEPLRSAFSLLEQNSKSDAHWQIYNYALGDTIGTQTINVAGNSFSSSLLPMLPSHVASAPESSYVGFENVELKTLDSVFPEVRQNARNIYLKIDTQGYENRVLAGAKHSLSHISTVQMEMSLVPLYGGELLFGEMCNLMVGYGFTLMRIENGLSDPKSGQLLQVDGIFRRL